MPAATARAHPNIAFIKYWGNLDDTLRLAVNASLSMNLESLFTQTRVEFRPGDPADSLSLNGTQVRGRGLERVSAFLDLVRTLAGIRLHAEVRSENNFPAGAGIASSASAFAALALSASKAAGLDLPEAALSRLARRGSGSACRSVPGGFVEWRAGSEDQDSYAVSIAPPEHWPLVDCIAILSEEHKPTGSTEGHSLAGTSPLQTARVADAPRRLAFCRQAVLERDFDALAAIVELDSNLMHAVMQTSTPALFYWLPATLAMMQAVREARRRGLAVCYTIDAGPNVHLLAERSSAQAVLELAGSIPGVREVRLAGVGGPARLLA